MKILMVLMGLDIGGAETHTAALSRALQRQGHEIIIVSHGGAYVPQLLSDGIRHIDAPLHRRAPRSMLQSLRILRKAIREEKPDLVHAHARIPAFLCGILQKRLHFPLITTAHWVFAVTPIYRLMTNWGDRTVAVSEDIRRYLMQNYRIPSDQITVTVNGIDTDLFAPLPPDSALAEALDLGSGPVVGLVSRLDEGRALAAEQLIAAAYDLADAVPGMEILIVGGGDREEKLRRKAEDVNLLCGRTVIHMTGARTDIAQLLRLMDVFVGVSRSALEAMSAEKPVILAGDEGYLGIFSEEKLETARGTNFCLRGSPMTTEEALRSDLIALLRMPEESRKKLGRFGRSVILEQYSIRRMTDDYLSAYEQLLHPTEPVRAVISGYYGFDNLGDDAILLSIQRQLEALPVRLTVLSRRPRETSRSYGLPAVRRFFLPAVHRAVRRSKILIFGGGSLLQDRTSTRSLRYYLWVIRTAQRLKKPVFLYANGIGPIERPRNRQKVLKTLAQCSCITLRDQDSLEELRSLGLSSENCVVTGDPAFMLEGAPQMASRGRLRNLGFADNRGIIGISVRAAGGTEQLAGEFSALGDRIYRELHRSVALLVMQESADLELSLAIQDQMEMPSQIVTMPGQAEEMLGVIGCMDAVVSMRLHTVIFAAKERVPVLGCIYDPKVSAFLKMLDMPSCGTPGEMTADAAFDALQQLLEHPQDVRENLDRRVQTLERSASETTLLLQKLLESQNS